MNVLLDTHILIWYLEGNLKLPKQFIKIIESPENHLYFSVASIWEMAIKISIGKLQLLQPLHKIIPEGINTLPISLN